MFFQCQISFNIYGNIYITCRMKPLVAYKCELNSIWQYKTFFLKTERSATHPRLRLQAISN